MNELLINSHTQQRIDNFISAPSHAVMLVGSGGSGKHSLAVTLSEQILGLQPGSFDNYPYKVLITAEDGKSIGIETIRQLEHFLSLKVPGQAAYNRAVLVEDANLLTIEAQNALLKTLEEPPAGVFIVLTANSEQALLPTIRSRAQSVQVKRPERAATEAYFETRDFDTQAVSQAYAISGGLPGLMSALLGETDHPLLLATQTARQLLSQTVYGRLLMTDELSKQRALARDTAFILQQMAHVSLQTAQGPAAAKWRAVLTAAYDAAEALAANAQPKLVLTNLMLSL